MADINWGALLDADPRLQAPLRARSRGLRRRPIAEPSIDWNALLDDAAKMEPELPATQQQAPPTSAVPQQPAPQPQQPLPSRKVRFEGKIYEFEGPDWSDEKVGKWLKERVVNPRQQAVPEPTDTAAVPPPAAATQPAVPQPPPQQPVAPTAQQVAPRDMSAAMAMTVQEESEWLSGGRGIRGPESAKNAEAVKPAEISPERIQAMTKAADEIARALSSNVPLGIGEHVFAAKVSPEMRPIVLDAIRRRYAADQTMKKVGYGTRLATSAVQGAIDFARPLAKMAGALPELDPEQERFRQEMLAVRQEVDPTIRPDTPTLGRWTQQAAQMSFPMVQSIGLARAGGGAAAVLGAGPKAAAAATGIGASASFLPQIADDTYTQLIGEGVSPDDAKTVTAIAAPVEAAVESFLPDPFKGMSGALRGTARQVARKVATEAIKRYGKELSEEVVQGAVREVGSVVASKLDEDVPDKGLGSVFTESLEAGLEAAGPLAIMMAPGGASLAVEGAASRGRKADYESIKATRATQQQAIDDFLQPQNVAAWVQANPGGAFNVASIETPSRKQWEEDYGFPQRTSQSQRKAFADMVRGVLANAEGVPGAEAVGGVPSEAGVSPAAGTAGMEAVTAPPPVVPPAVEPTAEAAVQAGPEEQAAGKQAGLEGEGTGLERLGEAGAAIVDNFYDAILQSINTTWRVPEQERNSSIGAAWRRARGKMTPEEFVDQLRTQGPDSIFPAKEVSDAVKEQEAAQVHAGGGPRVEAEVPQGAVAEGSQGVREGGRTSGQVSGQARAEEGPEVPDLDAVLGESLKALTEETPAEPPAPKQPWEMPFSKFAEQPNIGFRDKDGNISDDRLTKLIGWKQIVRKAAEDGLPVPANVLEEAGIVSPAATAPTETAPESPQTAPPQPGPAIQPAPPEAAVGAVAGQETASQAKPQTRLPQESPAEKKRREEFETLSDRLREVRPKETRNGWELVPTGISLRNGSKQYAMRDPETGKISVAGHLTAVRKAADKMTPAERQKARAEKRAEKIADQFVSGQAEVAPAELTDEQRAMFGLDEPTALEAEPEATEAAPVAPEAAPPVEPEIEVGQTPDETRYVPMREAEAAIADVDWTTRAGEREAMKRVKKIADKHGINPNELWREVVNEPEGGERDIVTELETKSKGEKIKPSTPGGPMPDTMETAADIRQAYENGQIEADEVQRRMAEIRKKESVEFNPKRVVRIIGPNGPVLGVSSADGTVRPVVLVKTRNAAKWRAQKPTKQDIERVREAVVPKANPVAPVAPESETPAIEPTELRRRLRSVENKSNRKGYEPLSDPELSELVAAGHVEGKGKNKGKLTSEGRRKLQDLDRTEGKQEAEDAAKWDSEQDAVVRRIEAGEQVSQQELDKYALTGTEWEKRAKVAAAPPSPKPESLADVRARQKAERDALEAEFDANTKRMSAEKSRAKTKAKRDALDDEYRAAKEAHRNRVQELLARHRDEMSANQEYQEQERATAERAKQMQADREAADKQRAEETDQADWQKVQDAGGVDAARSRLNDELKAEQTRLKRVGMKKQAGVESRIRRIEGDIARLDELAAKFAQPSPKPAEAPSPPKIDPRYKEDFDKILPALDRQVNAEISANKQKQVAVDHMDGEPPLVQRAIAERLQQIAPDAVRYANENPQSVPIGMREHFKAAASPAKPPAPAAPTATAPALQKGDIVSWDKQEARVLIPDLGTASWKPGVARIEYTTGPKKGQFQDVEGEWLKPLKPEETQAGKAAAEGARMAAEKAAKDKALHDEHVESIAVVVRKARKSGVNISPTTKKATKELISKIQLAHGTRNDAATMEAIEKVKGEAEAPAAAETGAATPKKSLGLKQTPVSLRGQFGLPGLEEEAAAKEQEEAQDVGWKPIRDKLADIGGQQFADDTRAVLRSIPKIVEDMAARTGVASDDDILQKLDYPNVEAYDPDADPAGVAEVMAEAIADAKENQVSLRAVAPSIDSTPFLIGGEYWDDDASRWATLTDFRFDEDGKVFAVYQHNGREEEASLESLVSGKRYPTTYEESGDPLEEMKRWILSRIAPDVAPDTADELRRSLDDGRDTLGEIADEGINLAYEYMSKQARPQFERDIRAKEDELTEKLVGVEGGGEVQTVAAEKEAEQSPPVEAQTETTPPKEPSTKPPEIKPEPEVAKANEVKHIVHWREPEGAREDKEQVFLSLDQAKKKAKALEQAGMRFVGVRTLVAPASEADVKPTDIPTAVKYDSKTDKFDVQALTPQQAAVVRDHVQGKGHYNQTADMKELLDAVRPKAEHHHVAEWTRKGSPERQAAIEALNKAQSEYSNLSEDIRKRKQELASLTEKLVITEAKKYGVPEGRRRGSLSADKKYSGLIANARGDVSRSEEVVRAKKHIDFLEETQRMKGRELDKAREEEGRTRAEEAKSAGLLPVGTIMVSREKGSAIAARIDGFNEKTGNYEIAQGSFIESTGTFMPSYGDRTSELAPSLGGYGTLEDWRAEEALRKQVDEALDAKKQAARVRSEREKQKKTDDAMRAAYRTTYDEKVTVATMLPVTGGGKGDAIYATFGGKPATSDGGHWLVRDDVVPKALIKRRDETNRGGLRGGAEGQAGSKTKPVKGESLIPEGVDLKAAVPLRNIGYIHEEGVDRKGKRWTLDAALLTDGNAVVAVPAGQYRYFSEAGIQVALPSNHSIENDEVGNLALMKQGKPVGLISPQKIGPGKTVDESDSIISYADLKGVLGDAIVEQATPEAKPSEKSKGRKAKPAAQGKAEEARKEIGEALDRIIESAKGSQPGALGLNRDMVAAVLDLVKAGIKLGRYEFQAFVERVVEKFGRQFALDNAADLRTIWEDVRKRLPTVPMSEPVDIAEMLAEKPSEAAPVETPSPQPVEKPETAKPKPTTEEAPAPEGDTTGTKNVKTDEMREKAGLGERVMPERQHVEDLDAEAARLMEADPKLARRMAEKLADNPEVVDNPKLAEAVMGRYMRDLENRRQAGEDVFDDLRTAVLADERIGTEWGRWGVSRQIERNADFSLAELVRKHTRDVGEPPSDEQMAKYEALADKVKEAEAALEEEKKRSAEEAAARAVAEAALAAANAKRPVGPIGHPEKRSKGTVEKARERWTKAAENVKEKFKALFAVGVAPDPTLKNEREFLSAVVEAIRAYADLVRVQTFTGFRSWLKSETGMDIDKADTLLRQAWDQEVGEGTIEVPEVDAGNDEEVSRLAQRILREVVESGVTETDEAIDAVHAELQTVIPDITREEARDAASGYGIYRQLPKDEISLIVRKIKGESQQTAKIEVLQRAIERAKELLDQGKTQEEVADILDREKLFPKMTGIERREAGDIERQLIKQVNELKKQVPVTIKERAGRLKSALGSAKTAVRNRIRDVKKEIETREKIIKTRTPLAPDAELTALREELADLMKIHKEMFPKAKATEAQRIAAAIRGLDRAIAQMESDLAAGRLAGKSRGVKLESPELTAQREKLQELRDKREDLREHDPAYQAKMQEARIAAREKELDRRIAALEADLAAGKLSGTAAKAGATSPGIEAKKKMLAELLERRKKARETDAAYQAEEELKRTARYKRSLDKRLEFWENRRDEAKRGILPQPKPKKEYTDKRVLDQIIKVDKAKREAWAEIEAEKRRRWDIGQKIYAGLSEAAVALPRELMAGLENSVVLRQGWFFTNQAVFHPQIVFARIVDGIQAMFSERMAVASRENLAKRVNASEYEKSGIEITTPHGPLGGGDELYQSRMIDWLASTENILWFPARWAAKAYIGTARGFSTFSNGMKADLYDMLKNDTIRIREFFNKHGMAKVPEWTKSDIELTGRSANIFGGRGTGLKHGGLKNYLLWAPKWVWSRIQAEFILPLQMATPKFIGRWNADPAIRLAHAKLYAQAAVGAATHLAILYWTLALLAGDDDEDKPKISFEPTSTDLLKLRMGETRIDVMGGLPQYFVFVSRLFTGKKTLASGEVVQLRGEEANPFRGDMWDEITRQGRYKLGPTASGLVDFFVQKSAVGQELPENPLARAGSIVGQRMVPMTWADVYEAEKSLNMKQGTVAAIEAFIGASVNTYGQITKYRNASEEERTKMVKEAKALRAGKGRPERRKDAKTPYQERLSKWREEKARAEAFLDAIGE